MRNGAARALLAVMIACAIAAGGCGLDETAGSDAGHACDGTCAGMSPGPGPGPGPTQCDDGVRNGDESDVDCGGGCPQCAGGRKCFHDWDCLTHFCAGGHCVATCWD